MPRPDYAPSEPLMTPGGRIASVDQDSPAATAGLVEGDTVVTVDGVVLRDVLDWQWYSDGPELKLEVIDAAGDSRKVTIERAESEGWGIEFEAAIFDGVRTCRNNCTFCFMSQLPKGMRKALYLRDDDFRLSFLQGNFVTLTNLDECDVQRIAEQRLSPLYVSLHAVDPDVRRELICAKDDRALDRLDELLGEGIDMHVQVVLVPGMNDGEVLDQTLTWLAEREGILSVGVVPLGYTGHQDRFSASFNDPIAAATVIQQVQRWQFASKERDKVSWVHLADEFYLNARAPIPTADWYDDYPQYENGIGLVRSFVDEAMELRPKLLEAVEALPEEAEAVTVVTGIMAATTLAGALNACSAAGRMRLLAVPNRFFGGNVAVTGLLTGRDLADAIKHDGASGIYLLPDVVLNADGVTLDDFTIDQIREQSGANVRLVSSDALGLLDGLIAAAEDLSSIEKE